MKFLIAVALFAGIFAVTQAQGVCYKDTIQGCTVTGEVVCNSRFGGIDNVESSVQSYINLQLRKSYQYLLMGTFFNSYQKNRPGFNKLYQGLSDRSFDETIDLIKQLTRRGGKVDFRRISENPNTISTTGELKLEVDELHSLAIALDTEKTLTDAATHVHYESTHGKPHDPEMAHYIEEKFLKPQAESIRKVSGYVNDLSKMLHQNDPSLSLYLFDEYLQKQ